MKFGKFLNNRTIFTASLLALLLMATILVWLSSPVPSFLQVQKSYRPSDIWMVDYQGYPLASIRTGSAHRTLDWVSWSEVSPAFRDLLVRIEDRRFYSHFGVDPLALVKSLWEKLLGHADRGGASTLTMQLVGLLKIPSASPTQRNGHRTFLQKWHQICDAIKLEGHWSKPEILEAYINLVSFRGELVGLRAVSLSYFGKNPSGLDHKESALLIALLRSPNAPPDLIAQRACRILDGSKESASCQWLLKLAEKTFSHPYNLSQRSLLQARALVPVLSKNFVNKGWDSSVIETSLDHRVQTLAISALHEQLRALKNQNVNDGAVLVLETKSGRVLAYVANGGPGLSSAEHIDGIQSKRQAGSTIKPFVFATAFDWKFLNPNSLLEDTPADISISQGRIYHPKNYDQTFRGFVSAAEALGSSLNVPTVRALQLVGESRILDRLRALGFQKIQEDDYYGPSLALGAIDVTLWELTQGYRQLALPHSHFSDQTRESIFNILASPEYRRFTFGIDGLLTLPFFAAVKTGTSKDMRDNWCIGWTSEYTVGVWVGNFRGEPMWNVSGMSGAAPIWRSLMLALHPPSQDPKNDSLNKQLTHYIPPATPLTRRTLSRIRYPAADMLVGLDPDIPPRLQKLPIEIENPQQGHKIFLNSQPLGRAQEIFLWPLVRGKFHIELKSSSGALVDAVKFEVR